MRIRLKMHDIYLRDKVRFCKTIFVLLGKSRFFLKINFSQYTLGSEYTRELFTVCENGDLRRLNIVKTFGKLVPTQLKLYY